MHNRHTGGLKTGSPHLMRSDMHRDACTAQRSAVWGMQTDRQPCTVLRGTLPGREVVAVREAAGCSLTAASGGAIEHAQRVPASRRGFSDCSNEPYGCDGQLWLQRGGVVQARQPASDLKSGHHLPIWKVMASSVTALLQASTCACLQPGDVLKSAKGDTAASEGALPRSAGSSQ